MVRLLHIAFWHAQPGLPATSTSRVITSTGSQNLAVVVSLPATGFQRVPVAAGSIASCPFERGARVDLFVGARSDVAEGAWILETTSGQLEILADKDGVRIAGPGMKADPISLH